MSRLAAGLLLHRPRLLPKPDLALVTITPPCNGNDSKSSHSPLLRSLRVLAHPPMPTPNSCLRTVSLAQRFHPADRHVHLLPLICLVVRAPRCRCRYKGDLLSHLLLFPTAILKEAQQIHTTQHLLTRQPPLLLLRHHRSWPARTLTLKGCSLMDM